jgi:hypothetical protein
MRQLLTTGPIRRIDGKSCRSAEPPKWKASHSTSGVFNSATLIRASVLEWGASIPD